MNKYRRLNWIVISIALGLAAFIWVMPEQQEGESFPPLTQLDPLEVDRIKIQNNNGPDYEIGRVDGEWQMLTPYRIKANTPRIEILLDLVSTPSLERFNLPEKNLQQFGLDKPRATVTFNETTLVMGGTHPSNYRRYMLNGNQLHLTKDAFPHHLLAVAEDFVSHKLFLDNEQISSIKSNQWEITQNSQHQWQLTPNPNGLDSEALAIMIETWNQAWAKKVVRIPKAKPDQLFTVYLKDNPQAITLETISSKRDTILIRRDRGVAYRIPSGSIFHITKPNP